MKQNGGWVQLSGQVPMEKDMWSGSLNGFLIGVLPSHLKPEARLVFPLASGDGQRIDLTPEGKIVLHGDPPSYLSLDNIQYHLHQHSQLPLASGWRYGGSPFAYPSYYLHHKSALFLQGVCQGGIDPLIGVLPVEVRPRKTQIVPVLTDLGILPLSVDSQGRLILRSGSRLPQWVSLNGVLLSMSPSNQELSLPLAGLTLYYHPQENQIRCQGRINLAGPLPRLPAPQKTLEFQTVHPRYRLRLTPQGKLMIIRRVRPLSLIGGLEGLDQIVQVDGLYYSPSPGSWDRLLRDK